VQAARLPFTVQENRFIVELDEHAIAQFLRHISQQHITYSHIAIDKPSLEDYFLSIAHKKGSV
jgi:hypothetical protein